MDHTKLKEIATSISKLPKNFPLTIEDYFADKEAYFVWEAVVEESVSVQFRYVDAVSGELILAERD